MFFELFSVWYGWNHPFMYVTQSEKKKKKAMGKWLKTQNKEKSIRLHSMQCRNMHKYCASVYLCGVCE